MYVVISIILVLPGSLSTYACENVYTLPPPPSNAFPIFTTSEYIHHLSGHHILIFIILHLPFLFKIKLIIGYAQMEDPHKRFLDPIRRTPSLLRVTLVTSKIDI